MQSSTALGLSTKTQWKGEGVATPGPFPSPEKERGRGRESMKLLLPVPHLISMVKLYWLKICALQIAFYYNYQQSEVHLNVLNQGLVE